MKYNLQETPPRSLDQVIVGAASDARWRHILMLPTLCNGDQSIDATKRHELEHALRRAESRARSETA